MRMEKEIIIEILEWNDTNTSIKIPELGIFKQFKYRVDAVNWANSIFKKPKFENVVYS